MAVVLSRPQCVNVFLLQYQRIIALKLHNTVYIVKLRMESIKPKVSVNNCNKAYNVLKTTVLIDA